MHDNRQNLEVDRKPDNLSVRSYGLTPISLDVTKDKINGVKGESMKIRITNEELESLGPDVVLMTINDEGEVVFVPLPSMVIGGFFFGREYKEIPSETSTVVVDITIDKVCVENLGFYPPIAFFEGKIIRRDGKPVEYFKRVWVEKPTQMKRGVSMDLPCNREGL